MQVTGECRLVTGVLRRAEASTGSLHASRGEYRRVTCEQRQVQASHMRAAASTGELHASKCK